MAWRGDFNEELSDPSALSIILAWAYFHTEEGRRCWRSLQVSRVWLSKLHSFKRITPPKQTFSFQVNLSIF